TRAPATAGRRAGPRCRGSSRALRSPLLVAAWRAPARASSRPALPRRPAAGPRPRTRRHPGARPAAPRIDPPHGRRESRSPRAAARRPPPAREPPPRPPRRAHPPRARSTWRAGGEAPQLLAGHVPVVEGDLAPALELLPLLVSLAGDHHGVAVAGPPERRGARRSAILLHDDLGVRILRDSLPDLIDDRARVFGARIVGGDHGHVRELRA